MLRSLARGLVRLKRGGKFLEAADLYSERLRIELNALAKLHSPDECRAIETRANRHLGAYMAEQKDWFVGVRHQLTEGVLWMADYGPLILNPEPEEDPTGFRGSLGVTGELRDKIMQVYTAKNYMPEMDHLTPSSGFNDVYHATFLLFQAARTIANSWNWVRLNMEGKTNPDWFRPFSVACFAWKEDQYRNLIGLPSILERDHPLGSMAPIYFSTAFTFVVAGDKNPYESWMRSMD